MKYVEQDALHCVALLHGVGDLRRQGHCFGCEFGRLEEGREQVACVRRRRLQQKETRMLFPFTFRFNRPVKVGDKSTAKTLQRVSRKSFDGLDHGSYRPFDASMPSRSARYQRPVISNLSKRCRNDVNVAKMSITAPLLRLFRQNRGAEIDNLAASTSFSTNLFSLLGQLKRIVHKPRGFPTLSKTCLFGHSYI